MTLSEYWHLKQQVILTVSKRDNNDLQSLKELFKSGINSNRRFEQINTIGQLLKVLELRALLTEDDVQPLKDIAKKIDSNELLRKIKDYEDLHIPRECNYYETLNNTTTSGIINSPNEVGVSKKKKERIFRTVVEEIGSFWRDLARSLHIREYEIDEIDFSCITLATKALKMMQKFEEKADKQLWFFTLCDALEKINRKDLLRSVKKIMTMNI